MSHANSLRLSNLCTRLSKKDLLYRAWSRRAHRIWDSLSFNHGPSSLTCTRDFVPLSWIDDCSFSSSNAYLFSSCSLFYVLFLKLNQFLKLLQIYFLRNHVIKQALTHYYMDFQLCLEEYLSINSANVSCEGVLFQQRQIFNGSSIFKYRFS